MLSSSVRQSSSLQLEEGVCVSAQVQQHVMIGGAVSPTGDETTQETVLHGQQQVSSTNLSINSSQGRQEAAAATGGVGGDVSHQLSILHHYHSIRENSDRSLMLRLQALGAAEEQSREEAGRRALAFLQQFKSSIQFDFKFQNAQAALQEEITLLKARKVLLLEKSRELKARQNSVYKGFSYLLLLCGLFCFFNGALELHSSNASMSSVAQGAGGAGNWFAFSHTETTIIEWSLFQIR